MVWLGRVGQDVFAGLWREFRIIMIISVGCGDCARDRHMYRHCIKIGPLSHAHTRVFAKSAFFLFSHPSID